MKHHTGSGNNAKIVRLALNLLHNQKNKNKTK